MKILLFAIALMLFVGCETVDTNNVDANKWITTAKKPIIVTKTTRNGWTYNLRYSLRSADNDFYSTDEVSISLPDTIKAN